MTRVHVPAAAVIIGWDIPYPYTHLIHLTVDSTLFFSGFEIAALEPWTIRTNLGNPEPGHLVIARRPA